MDNAQKDFVQNLSDIEVDGQVALEILCHFDKFVKVNKKEKLVALTEVFDFDKAASA